jgi:hypothetical protein
LYKAGLFADAVRAAIRVEGEQYAQRVLMLQSVIKYEQDELPASKGYLDQCHSDEPDVIVNYAAIAFKEGNFESARTQYSDALNTMGYQADLAYNIALCYFRMKQFGPALRTIAEIIDKGIRNHPELSVGTNTDGVDVRSVGNSAVLKETCLIEAFNLKAAIEFEMKSTEPAKVATDSSAAKEALTDMPPRLESELDPVSLHNQVWCACFSCAVRADWRRRMSDQPSSCSRSNAFLPLCRRSSSARTIPQRPSRSSPTSSPTRRTRRRPSATCCCCTASTRTTTSPRACWRRTRT